MGVLIRRENSFNAIKSYTNPFIVIQIYKFPSLPLIYNFYSLVCHCCYFFVDSPCTPLKLCHGGVQVVSRGASSPGQRTPSSQTQGWSRTPTTPLESRRTRRSSPGEALRAEAEQQRHERKGCIRCFLLQAPPSAVFKPNANALFSGCRFLRLLRFLI